MAIQASRNTRTILVQKVEKNRIGYFLSYFVQNCFICRPSDSSVSEDAGIEYWAIEKFALGSNHSVRSHSQSVRSHTQSVRSHPL
jgi:hypothetical protein